MHQLPPLIGLSGYGETGKSEVARILRREFGYEGSHVKDPMMEMAISLLARMGVDTTEALDRLDGATKNEPIPGWPWLTGRKILQIIGKDFRDAMGDPAKRTFIPAPPKGGVGRPVFAVDTVDETFFLDLWRRENQAARVINESLRYPFEGHYFQANGGYVIRVTVPGQGPLSDHPSETSVVPFDYELVNHKRSLGELKEALVAALDAAPAILAARNTRS